MVDASISDLEGGLHGRGGVFATGLRRIATDRDLDAAGQDQDQINAKQIDVAQRMEGAFENHVTGPDAREPLRQLGDMVMDRPEDGVGRIDIPERHVRV